VTDWTRGEIEVVAAAVQAAPSVHNTQPWVLEFHDDGARGVSLFQRLDRTLPRHDPHGRDGLISCGAALQNLVLAMRVLGWTPDIAHWPTTDHPDEVARVSSTTRHSPSNVDCERYAAIPARRSYRGPFTSTPVEPSTRDILLSARDVDGVEVRPVDPGDQVDGLAKVLEHAALVLKGDRAYQHELAAWTSTRPNSAPGAGVATRPRRLATLPWAGLVRRSTGVPDRVVLADRLRRECLLVVETPDDGRLDQVRAGMAAEATWLAATAGCLAGSMLTQPVRVREVRAGLIEGLELAGFPQVLLRFGHPAGAPATTTSPATTPPATRFAALRDGTEEDPS
jgi:hypothetical protein